MFKGPFFITTRDLSSKVRLNRGARQPFSAFIVSIDKPMGYCAVRLVQLFSTSLGVVVVICYITM